jgi:hypothetical protein
MWTAVFAAGIFLSAAAIGCGDDDTATPAAGSGGSTSSGSGGSAGKSGASGSTSAGKSGGGGTGGTVSASQCVTDTTSATQGGIAADCIKCACDNNAAQVEACDKTSNSACWALIQCVNKNCTGASDITCITTKCTDSLAAGMTNATPTGTILSGACASKCGSDDAGAADAGN